MVARSLAPLTAPPNQDKYQRRVGSGLTPQLISSVLRAADLGYMDQWADLLDEVRQADPHLHGELAKREQQVAGAPREVRPGDVGKRAQAAADYCAEILDTLEVPPASLALSFSGVLAHLLTGVYQGRAACEAVWVRDGRALRPARIQWIHARRLAYAATDWKLHVWDATSLGTPFSLFPGVPVDDPRVFPAGKLLLHTPRLYGTYPTREGLGRCLVWFAAFKRWGIRDWLGFAEWAGRGMRIGKYATGTDPKSPGRATEEDKEALEAALQAMSSSVATVIADTTDLELVAPPANGEVHERLTLLCNNEISKATLGGTLSSDPGERGARSLGEVQERVRLAIAAADAAALAETIRRDLFAPAVRERYGDKVAVPTLAIQTAPAESLDAMVGRVDKLAARGLRVPAAWLRDTLGIPEPKADEETIGGAAPAAESDGDEGEPSEDAPAKDGEPADPKDAPADGAD